MGVIDKLWVKVSCHSCGTTETSSAVDRGSGWSTSKWSEIGRFEKFNTESRRNEIGEPEIVSATCCACGVAATINHAYGFAKPDEY